jgi:hypothetical protein
MRSISHYDRLPLKKIKVITSLGLLVWSFLWPGGLVSCAISTRLEYYEVGVTTKKE